MPPEPGADEGSLDRQRRALQLVADAQDLPRDAQGDFLAQACGDDEAMRHAVAALLARIDDVQARDGFLAESAVDFAQPIVQAVLAGEERSRLSATAAVQHALDGRYVLGDEVGRGGSAVVYRARDVRHHRQVAVKIVFGDDSATANSQRFVREIAIAARLQHPYILPLLDSGRADGALFYVMPLVEGETLRHRLDRERVLPLNDALSLAGDIAEALDAAHALGVVHRDIKPSNILLEQSHAVVADFGIALALESSATRMTATGHVIGTPHYMSPEQAAGDEAIDVRSDVYSLGCVVYEMLAGEVPYPGGTAQAVRAKHMHAAIPDVTVLRPSLPREVGPVLARALAKSPSDRFASAGAFVAALRLHVTAAPPEVGDRGTSIPEVTQGKRAPSRGLRSRGLRWIGGALLLAAGIAAAWAAPRWWRSRDAAVLDPRAIVLLPVARRGEVPPTLRESDRLRDALRSWRDLRVVDAPTIEEALDDAEGGEIPLTASQRVARSLGAGRFVRASVSGDGESVWLRAMLYRSDSARLTSEASLRLDDGAANADSAFDRLVYDLLFRERIDLLPRILHPSTPGTRSYEAHSRFLDGQLAVSGWDLAAADSAFAHASRQDRDYRQAWLWLGLVRRWGGREVAVWRGAAQQAGYSSGSLGSRDSVLAGALLALSEDRTPAACRALDDLVARAPQDFSAWYASADCRARDSLVVRDARSASGWSFRSSRHAAVEHYQRAFSLLPSILRGLRPDGFRGARALFQVSRSILVSGRAAPSDTTRFYSYPALVGDSLVFVPVPVDDFQRGVRPLPLALEPPGVPLSGRSPFEAARMRQRRIFRDVAAAWVAEAPGTGSYEALGIALQWLGDPAALDTLRTARRLASMPLERAQATATAVVVGVLLGAPDDSSMLVQAMQLADSLLADSSLRMADPRGALTLAALSGRAALAARLAASAPGYPTLPLPPHVRPTAERLLVFGALGGPVDSLRMLEREVETLLERPVGDVPPSREAALRRPAVLALPEYRLASLPTLTAGPDLLLAATQAWAAQDTARVLHLLGAIDDGRRAVAPEDVSLDARFPEAVLWNAIGLPREAASHLDATLSVLPRVTLSMSDPAAAASLVRAMALRAEVAHILGDRAEARRWARAVLILWRSADPFLHPTLGRMRALMS